MAGRGIRAASWTRLLLLGAVLVSGACASNQGRPVVADEDYAAIDRDDVLVTVENQNFKDAVVYAIWGAGPRNRMGLVTGNTTKTLTTPFRTGDLRIEVDFIAGDDVLTESMGVFHGDHVQVTIPPSP